MRLLLCCLQQGEALQNAQISLLEPVINDNLRTQRDLQQSAAEHSEVTS